MLVGNWRFHFPCYNAVLDFRTPKIQIPIFTQSPSTKIDIGNTDFSYCPVLPSGILKPLEYVRLTKSVSSRFQNFVTGQTWSVYFLIFLASFVRSSWVSEQWP